VVVAAGASRYQQAADSRDRWRTPYAVKPPFLFDSPQDWSGWVLRNSWQSMEYLSEHIYGAEDEVAFDFSTQRWQPNVVQLQDHLRQIPNRVQGVAEDWIEYRNRMPWLKDTNIKMVLDEWHAGGNDLFVGLWTGLVLNELFRHTDTYVMSAWTCAACALSYNHFDPPVYRSGGLVFKLVANQMETIPVLGITGNSPQPELRGTVGVDRPQTSSGSPTYPLDVMAAVSQDGRRLTVTVVNPSESAQQLTLQLLNRGAAAAFPNAGRKWTIAGADINARNVPGQEQQIKLVESQVADLTAAHAVPPVSISLYEFVVR
jgi:alpha-N-arabinofuranosidase